MEMMANQVTHQESLLLHRSGVQPIGAIAIRLNLLTAEQVLEVCDEQKRWGLRFGEVAFRMGFLTSEQLQTLIAAKREHDELTDLTFATEWS